MPKVLWTGKLSFSGMCLLNATNIIAMLGGKTRNINSMKMRMKDGYNGKFTDHVTRYDEEGEEHYTEIADKLLSRMDVKGKKVLDVGCGTGILSLSLLKKGASDITCGDFADFMLTVCKNKLSSKGFNNSSVKFMNIDAGNLPFPDNSFDVVTSSMMIGLAPDQRTIISEMVRVLKPGGSFAFSTHGPCHYMEANDAIIKAVPKRYAIGYRIEFWPQNGKKIRRIIPKDSVEDIDILNEVKQHDFGSGKNAYGFFAATSSSWWFERLPENIRSDVSDRFENYFCEKNITKITSDVVFAYGRKKGA